MVRYRSLLFIPLILSLITACVPVKQDKGSVITPEDTQDIQRPVKTSLPTLKPTEFTTVTPVPTAKIPDLSLKVITTDNVSYLTQIKMLGDGQITDVAFSPGGGLIAASSTIGIRLHGGVDLIERAFIPGADPVTRVTFSPDGKLLAAGTQAGTIEIYVVEDLINNKNKTISPARKIKANNYAITCLVFSPDSRSLSSGSQDRTILIWNPSTGRRVRSLGGFLLGVSAIAYSIDSTFLAGSSLDGTTRIWRISSGELINSSGEPDTRRYDVDRYPISLGFLPAGELVSTWADSSLTGWAWQGKNSESVDIQNQPQGYSFSLNNAKKQQIIGITTDGVVQVFGTGSASPDGVKLLPGITFETNAHIISASISMDGQRLVTASYPSEIDLWDMKSGDRMKTYSRGPHGQQLLTSAFSPDSKLLATAHGDGLIRIWDTVNMQNYFEFEVNNAETTRSMLFPADGKYLLTGTDAIYLYSTDVLQNLLRRQLSDPIKTASQLPALRVIRTGGIVRSIALSSDGKYLASANLLDKSVQIWDPVNGKLIDKLDGFSDPVEVLAFSPDSQNLAAGSADHTVRIWHSDNLTLKTVIANTIDSEIPIPQKSDLVIKTEIAVLSLVFSPDGKQLAIAGAGWNVRVVDSTNGGLLFHFKGAKYQVTAIAISTDGKLFATGDADGIIRVYGSGQGVPLLVLEGHASMVNTLNFSPDRRMLISGGEDSTIRLWGIVD